MKRFLAVVGGFVVALGTFAGGALVAFLVLAPEPDRAISADVDTTDVWSSEPRRVDVAAQDFERVAGVEQATEGVAREASPGGQDAAAEGGEVDTMTTASLDPMDEMPAAEPGVADDLQAGLIAAHVDWCYGRYRSYDVDTNTYRPFSGGLRDCVSPYLEEIEALAAGGRPEALPDGGGTMAEPAEFAAVEERPAYVETGRGGVAMLHIGDRQAERPADGFSSAPVSNAPVSSAHVRDCFSRYRSYRPEDNSYQPFGGGPRRQCE